MRKENQPWALINIACEIVSLGSGLTGLTVQAYLENIRNGEYLQSGGGWGASPSVLTLTQVDSTNLPGVYSYRVDPSDLTWANGAEGYIARIIEATQNIREHIYITPIGDINDAVDTSAITANSLVDMLFRALGLMGHIYRTTYSTFTVANQPATGTLKVYGSNADANADTNALAVYAFVATYDGDNRLTSYVVTKTT